MLVLWRFVSFLSEQRKREVRESKSSADGERERERERDVVKKSGRQTVVRRKLFGV